MSTDDGRRMVAEALDALDPWELDDGELARLLCGRIVSLHGSVPRYCPNCGARVVGQA